MLALASAIFPVVERTREYPRQRLRLTAGRESGLAPRPCSLRRSSRRPVCPPAGFAWT